MSAVAPAGGIRVPVRHAMRIRLSRLLPEGGW